MLKGYCAMSNVRLRSEERGGVKETDILGLRLVRGEKEVLEIMHVEVGSLTGNFEENLKNVRGKIVSERVKTVKEISLGIIELESVVGTARVGQSRMGVSEIKYVPMFVASYVAEIQVERLREELGKDGIRFMTLDEVLREALKDIDEWKEAQVRQGLRRTTGSRCRRVCGC